MELKDLIKCKETHLNNLFMEEEEYVKKMEEYKNNEKSYYLNTDFKQLGLTNEKLRKSYVEDKLKDSRIALKEMQVNIDHMKRCISLHDDRIRAKELEIQHDL